MEIIYSDDDQAKIDNMQGTIRNYEEALIFRLRQDGQNWAATEQELNAAFMADPVRVQMHKTLVDMMARMMPMKIKIKRS